MSALSSKEILEKISDSSVPKAKSRIISLFLLGILAGLFIAFGAEASTMASFNLSADSAKFGLSRVAAGCVFPVGLMLVVLCGAELFTGNCLMTVGWLDKKIKLSGIVKNWTIVYLGNFIGAIILALFMNWSGLYESAGGALGAAVVKTAVTKVGFGFGQAVLLGIMCNMLVCLAVWMATGARSVTGKIFSCFFCIFVFIVSGFEHSVANMYFIPAGLIASTNNSFVRMAGIDISNLNAGSFFLNNLIPVTIGNIIGGAVLVGIMYWIIHRKANK